MYRLEEAISEKLVVYIWQHQLVSNLVTDTGGNVHVIFPGRISSNRGGDFSDAVMTIGNKSVLGDIEIHVRSSQWYAHGHHQDSHYNNIVLHVVMWHDHPSTTVLQNGNNVPTIELWASLAYPLNRLSQRPRLSYGLLASCPSIKTCVRDTFLINVLNTAGKKRFYSRVDLFKQSLAADVAGQVLFRNIARALGYDKNTGSFEQLADMLPLKLLEKIDYDKNSIHQALILGVAGLLPSQRLHRKQELSGAPDILELETIWQSSKKAGTMCQSQWNFFRVRPDNLPTRRLVALSYLLNRYSQLGLLQGILSLVRESSGEHTYQCIERGLIIPAQGYWTNHIDFGVTMTRCSALLGRSKAAEIVVNIILPFVYAWGELYSDPILQKKALSTYRNYPKLEDNQLIRFMRQQLLLRPGLYLSALQQQGMIYIFKNYCRYRNCRGCPVSLNQN